MHRQVRVPITAHSAPWPNALNTEKLSTCSVYRTREAQRYSDRLQRVHPFDGGLSRSMQNKGGGYSQAAEYVAKQELQLRHQLLRSTLTLAFVLCSELNGVMKAKESSLTYWQDSTVSSHERR